MKIEGMTPEEQAALDTLMKGIKEKMEQETNALPPNIQMIADMSGKLGADIHSAVQRNLEVMLAGGMSEKDVLFTIMVGIETYAAFLDDQSDGLTKKLRDQLSPFMSVLGRMRRDGITSEKIMEEAAKE